MSNTYQSVRRQLLDCRDNPHRTAVRRPGHAHEANRRFHEKLVARRQQTR